MYRLNPELWGGCFAVPDVVTDKYLKLASGACFKVLLYLLKNPSRTDDVSAVASATGLTPDAAEDALLYWQRENVLITAGEASPPSEKAPESSGEAEPGKKEVAEKTGKSKKSSPARPLPIKPPTHSEIAMRLSQSCELSFIFSEAQDVLGETFGYNTQSILLMVYDYYGFPADVLLMLVQHAKLTGNASAQGIKKLAESWSKHGVCTLADAEDQIGIHNKILSTYERLSKSYGFELKTPNDTQARYLKSWIYTFEFDLPVISLAFEKAEGEGARNSFAYVNKLLKQWYDKGYRDSETIVSKLGASRAKGNKPVRSYDTAKMGRSVIFDWIKKSEGGND